MNAQQGFTLIELMIVVAIIGILASFAIPAYQDHLGRAQVTEALNLITGLKIEFTSSYGETGACPINGMHGYSPASSYSGKYVDHITFGGPIASVTDSTCSMVVTFKATNIHAELAGKNIIVAMTVGGTTSTTSQWEMHQTITNGTVPTKLLPSTIR